MARPSPVFLPVIVILGGILSAAVVRGARLPAERPESPKDPKTVTVEVTDYTAPTDNDTLLVDDRIADKKTIFDPNLADRRGVGGWKINASAAVMRLDVPIVKPDVSPELLVLHPSYRDAVKQAKGEVLPSVNMIDGKAKQFDDGLYAAIDQAYFAGRDGMKGHLELIERIYAKTLKGTPACDYLAAGLRVAGRPVEASASARSVADHFLSQQVFSKPIGVYTWTPTLSNCFRTLRFFSRPIEDDRIIREITRVLLDDKTLLDDYRKATSFYGKLSNPLVGMTPADTIVFPVPKGVRVSLFPPSSSREAELFQKLFPLGLPPDANLMRELITAIRSGKVDLKPRENGGWYDYQVHALETLLLPEKAEESNKLLLTKLYKKRMLDAFKALMTKRRETHVRQLDFPAPGEAAPVVKELAYLQPRLRVEPNPTYYLRTARSYRFLGDFLESSLGESTMKSLHGLRETGPRELSLHAELRSMRDLFYGFYLMSAEDIGLKPSFLEGEDVDRDACENAANDWLLSRNDDADLAADTRVSAPVYYDMRTGKVRLWMTIGVRLAILDARYATSPRVRPEVGPGDWKELEPHKLVSREYLIPVDEFAEVELKGGKVLTRAELRAVCDRMKTKEKILEALGK